MFASVYTTFVPESESVDPMTSPIARDNLLVIITELRIEPVICQSDSKTGPVIRRDLRLRSNESAG